jgi:hypothetical protein
VSLATLSSSDGTTSTAVLTGRLVLPFSGLWHVDVELISEVVVAGSQILTFVGTDWACFPVRSVSFTGRTGVRLVAGKGGWRGTPIPAKQYASGSTVSQVTGDAALACGETSPVIDSSVPNTVSQGYCRPAGLASLILQEVLGDLWYADNTGVVQTASRSGVISSSFQALSVAGAQGIYEIGTDDPNSWLPGASFSGPTVTGIINRVEHVIKPDSLRTLVYSP